MGTALMQLSFAVGGRCGLLKHHLKRPCQRLRGAGSELALEEKTRIEPAGREVSWVSQCHPLPSPELLWGVSASLLPRGSPHGARTVPR